MILGSITKHVKEQNWIAIGIDFCIVVVGVFIGIQVANWNENLNDKARADDYLVRLVRDLDTDIAGYRDRLQFWGQVSSYGKLGLNYHYQTEQGEVSNWALLLAFSHASQLAEFIPSKATYNELISAGELRLIENASIRDLLSNYYTNSTNGALSERPEYRVRVRGYIPIDIQDYIWSNCYGADASVQTLLDCDSPISQVRAGDVLKTIINDESLMRGLRYWVSTLRIASIISQNQLEQANGLRLDILKELGSNER